jgi:hypothetical protein
MITGTRLNKRYKLGALQARYRENGYWYHPPNERLEALELPRWPRGPQSMGLP